MKFLARLDRLAALLAVLAPVATMAAPVASAAGASEAAGRPMTGGMLTRQAQEEHLRRMASFKTYEECSAYMDDWRARSLSQGRGQPASAASAPAHEECAGLPHGKP